MSDAAVKVLQTQQNQIEQLQKYLLQAIDGITENVGLITELRARIEKLEAK